MKPRFLAFMTFVLMLAAFGCSEPKQPETVDAPLQLDINPEDLMEIQPDSEQEQAYLSPAQVQESVVADSSVTSQTPIQTFEGSLVPTASPNPDSLSTPAPRTSYLITDVHNERGYVKSSGVNIREGPGTSYPVVEVARANTVLVITGKTEEWYRVKIGSVIGFILKEFIGLGSVPTPTPKPTPKPTSTAKATKEPEIKQGEKGNFSDDDIYLAAKLIYAEGKSQTTESFLAMANVLYNRVNSKTFGGSVETEVYRSGQFSVVRYSNFESLVPSSAAKKAAKQVFNDGKRVLPSGVMYFRSSKLGQSWSRSRKFYKKIGGNNYYY